MALVAVGVSGGISAYKAVEVVRQLQKAGHQVAVVMTRAATRFVGPLTFEAITQRRVITSQWTPGANADIEHIALASEAALLLVAPATANTIAKLAHGMAGDFLTSLALATRAPVLVAPAMNTHMYDHPATQANMALLRTRGVRFVEPGEGYLACGWVGKGRLAEPDVIAAEALRILEPPPGLAGTPRPRDRRPHVRGSRSCPLPREPVEWSHGCGRRRSGRATGGRGDARARTDARSPRLPE